MERMTSKAAFIFTTYLSLALGCKYSTNTKLLKSTIQNSGDSTVVLTNRTIDTDGAYAGSRGIADIQFIHPIQIMRADMLNYHLRVCDNGVVQLADMPGYLEKCKTQTQLNSTSISYRQPVIVADAISTSLMINIQYFAEIYHIRRSEQFDANGNVVGPSFCDIQRIEGIINDCEETHRNDLMVVEAAVVTWRTRVTTYMPMDYDFQVIVAVTSTNRTYVVFLYDSTQTVYPGANGVVKGVIQAVNGQSWPPGPERFSKICGAETDTSLHLKSNCRCAELGHFVMETTEFTTAPHGYCGEDIGKDTCSNQNFNVDDGKTINKNCRTPRTPVDTCDTTYYCQSTTTNQLIITFRNHNADRITFIDYTTFTQADGDSGFQNPHGDNIVPLASCQVSLSPSDSTYQSLSLNVTGTTSPCLEYVSVTNSFNFAMLFWHSVNDINITVDGSMILVGSCDLDNLPPAVNISANVLDVFAATVPTVTAQSLVMNFWDRRYSGSDVQVLSGSLSTVALGRKVYPAICFRRGTPYTEDVNVYGVSAHSCQLSKNPEFVNSPSNGHYTLDVIQPDGCVSSTLTAGSAGSLYDNFKVRNNESTPQDPFCIIAGPFDAFIWNNANSQSKIYMRCITSFCKNTQLYRHSKCWNSCGSTITDSNVTDPGEDRRRRQAEENEEVVVGVIDVIDIIQANGERNNKNCTDPVMAKGVIGSLVALLILATIMTAHLFFLLQKKKV